MSEITPGGILDRVGAEIPNFFRDGVDQLVTGEGEYIRSGEPQGTVGKIGQAIARSYCRQYGADPGAARFGNAARIENACRPYLDDQDPGKGAEIDVPFDGGQCGIPYLATIEVDQPGQSNPIGITGFRALGPIGSISLVEFFTQFRLKVTTAGLPTLALECGAVGGAEPAPVTTTFSFPLLPPGSSIRSISIVACSGVDVCGDPPPIVRQPRPIIDPTGPNFRFNPSGDINVNVGVDVLPNGTINVNVGGPTINVDPFSGGGGDGDGGGPTGPGPGDIGDAGGASSTGDGGEAEGEAGAGEILVGIKIDILTSPPKARQFAPGVFRGACYIYMGVASNLDQDYGGSMLRSGQFFFAEKENLTHWLVSANTGYSFNVTPYYREVEE